MNQMTHTKKTNMQTAVITTSADPEQTLSKAYLAAGKKLGLTQSELGDVIGRNRSALYRGGISPQSKQGELALLLIRIYRSLFVLVGDDRENLKHWMKTENNHTGGIPLEQVKTIPGIMLVLEYLDAMRGKV